jgi:hypothetical protein
MSSIDPTLISPTGCDVGVVFNVAGIRDMLLKQPLIAPEIS